MPSESRSRRYLNLLPVPIKSELVPKQSTAFLLVADGAETETPKAPREKMESMSLPSECEFSGASRDPRAGSEAHCLLKLPCVG